MYILPKRQSIAERPVNKWLGMSTNLLEYSPEKKNLNNNLSIEYTTS